MTTNTGGRTRVLKQPQSRNGCFTCKTRRVRCDAAKPVCQRCIKGHRQCGYRDHDPSDGYNDLTGNDALICITVDSRHKYSHSDTIDAVRLVKLACNTLHYNAPFQGGAAAPFWSFTLPQLSHTHSVVGAAAAALGAAIEMHRNPMGCKSSSLLRWYVDALESTRSAIGLAHATSTPIIAACILLAITEVLAGQEVFALSHLQGALGLLVQKQQKQKVDDAARYDLTHTEGPVKDDSAFRIVDEVDAAGAVLDISTSTYALGLEPRLPTLAFRGSLQTFHGTDSLTALEITVLRALHSSYRFAAKYNAWRYVPQSFRPDELTLPQSLLADQLFRNIEDLKHLMPTLTGVEQSRARNLSMQCTSCLIYVACLFEPKETCYDRFLSHFEELILQATALRTHWYAPPTAHLDLSLDLGCIQPLFLTAFKCREPIIRRRAIQLLEQADHRELAFDAKQHAAVARRAMELEERAAGIDVHNTVSSCAASIPEGVRLHGAGVEVASSSPVPLRLILASFSRCRDVDGMMNEHTIDGFNSQHWWDIWNESLRISS